MTLFRYICNNGEQEKTAVSVLGFIDKYPSRVFQSMNRFKKTAHSIWQGIIASPDALDFQVNKDVNFMV